MRAVDINVLARFYLRDDAVQARIATGILAAGDVLVPKTVVQEPEPLLRSMARLPTGKVIVGSAHLIALPGVSIEGDLRCPCRQALAAPLRAA